MHPSSSTTANLDALLLRCHQPRSPAGESAQRTLYERYFPFAISLALHYASDRSEAEEIVQDAFVKLFQSLAGNPFGGNFTSYFRRIIVNTGIDHYRARRRREGYLRRLLPTATAPDCAENDALRALGEQDVLRVIQRLSPGYRLVFNLHVVEGYSHTEIAERLGITASTSKSNLAKARRALARIIDTYYPTTKTARHE